MLLLILFHYLNGVTFDYVEHIQSSTSIIHDSKIWPFYLKLKMQYKTITITIFY